jgi:hypothetical protein
MAERFSSRNQWNDPRATLGRADQAAAWKKPQFGQGIRPPNSLDAKFKWLRSSQRQRNGVHCIVGRLAP